MNHCQIEYDTEKYLGAQCVLESANDAAEEAAEAQVNDSTSIYFWADAGNMLEALCEADTPVHRIKNNMLYADQLQTLIASRQYEAYGKLCEEISKEYWTNWLVDLE